MSVSRRRFLATTAKTAGALAATAAFPSLLSGKQPAEKLGVALVGIGTYSNMILGPSFENTESVYLAGIVTGTPAKATEWQEKYGLKSANIYDYENFDSIADNDEIDIVYIVLPNSMHAPFAIRALEAGKHVIVEKPMATSAEDARNMIATAERMGKQLSVGYRLHFDPWHREAMRIGEEKVFGDISFIEASLGFRYSFDQSSWKMQKSMGGGPFFNLATYPVQAARYIKRQEPIAVTAQAFTQNPIYTEVDETVAWVLEFADGSIAKSMASAAGYLDRTYAAAENGWLEIQPSFNYSGTSGRTSEGSMDFEAVHTSALQMDDFARCILNNETSRISGAEGLKDVIVMDAILEAARTGKRVEIG